MSSNKHIEMRGVTKAFRFFTLQDLSFIPLDVELQQDLRLEAHPVEVVVQPIQRRGERLVLGSPWERFLVQASHRQDRGRLGEGALPERHFSLAFPERRPERLKLPVRL